jgi:hemerythrin-like domain-containing protein
MGLFTQLAHDHNLLRIALGSMKTIVEKERLPEFKDYLPGAVDFFQIFMDQYHHHKEERFVFPLIQYAPRDVKDLLPDLLGDHRRAKDLADSLASALRAEDLQRFGQAMLQLYDHMDEHIGEEDRKIWPAMKLAVPAKLSEAAFIDVNHYFELQMGADFTARMERFAKELKAKAEAGRI